MDNTYDSKYSIAIEINLKLGNAPKNFDSTYSICMDIYHKLGGVKTSFDSVYSILESIMQLINVEHTNKFDSIYSQCLSIYNKLGGEHKSFDSTYSILLGILPLVGEGPEPGQIPNDEIWYTSEDGNIIIPYKESSLPTIVSNTYINGKGIFKFDSDVTSIGSLAFRNRSLTTITIPNSVTSIGSLAFYNCPLTSITIPDSVTSIGNYAFRNCYALPSITIPNSVTSIGYNPFDSCLNLTSIIVESGNTAYDSRNNCNAIITTVANILYSGCKNTIIPNDTEEIGIFAFGGCTGLTSIEIPVSVLYIDDLAFYGCTGLTSISYKGTIEQYNAITKGANWNYNVPATVVHCTDGDAPI